MHPAVAGPGRLAYVRRSFDVNIWRVAEGTAAIEPLSSSTLGDTDASYSPDGSRLAFVTDREGEGSDVWTANADGTRPVALTRGGGHSYGSPRWSPDGTQLVFDGRGTDGLWHVWMIDASGGEARYAGQGNLPSWSRDGRSIYFGSIRSGRQEIWRMDTGGGGVRQVTTGGGSAPVESPDGRTLYFVRDGGLHALPVDGGPDRQVLASLEGWTYWPAEQGLFFVSRRPGRDSRQRDIRVLDPTTGRDRLFASFHLDYHWSGLCVSPDGRTVLVYGVEAVSADVMLLDGYR
jgi:Tol biopolymer transport system component